MKVVVGLSGCVGQGLRRGMDGSEGKACETKRGCGKNCAECLHKFIGRAGLGYKSAEGARNELHANSILGKEIVRASNNRPLQHTCRSRPVETAAGPAER